MTRCDSHSCPQEWHHQPYSRETWLHCQWSKEAERNQVGLSQTLSRSKNLSSSPSPSQSIFSAQLRQLIYYFWPPLLMVFPSSLNVTIMVVGSCPYLGIISSPTYLESLVSSSPSIEPRRCRPQPQLHFRPRFRSPEHVARAASQGYLATADKISGDIWRCYKDQWQRNVRHGSFYCPSG